MQASHTAVLVTSASFKSGLAPFPKGGEAFAPVVLEEATGSYFTHSYPSPFMLMTYPVRPEKIHEIPGVRGTRTWLIFDEHEGPGAMWDGGLQ
jgi:hypothetical protein